MQLFKKTLNSKLVACALLFLCAFLLLSPQKDFDLSFYEKRSSQLLDFKGQMLAFNLDESGRLKLKTQSEDVDPLYLKLLILTEDERFFNHPGVDLIAIVRAFSSNLIRGQRISGASTLAMQVSRMLNPKARNLKAKINEALTALSLTSTLGRNNLLDLYLTIAPMGGYLHGVKAASLRYFGHEPSTLSPAEAALLVALPRSPEKIRPDIKENLKRAKFYRDEILIKAYRHGLIKKDVLEGSLKTPLPTTLKPLEQNAYHLGHFIFANAPKEHIQEKEFYAFVDLNLQLNLAREALFFAKDHPQSELSIIVIDDKSHSVQAYVGSSNYKKVQEDLTQAIRSPGSTLKPFAYAQAFDLNLAHPKSILNDRQISINSYLPQNFDRTFKGELTLAEALVNSLNIPALEILKRLGPQNFYDKLNTNHQRLYLPKGATPSLPIILGGVGVKPYDLAVLFSALNLDGKLIEPKLFCLDREKKRCLTALFKESSTQNFLSPQSARATFDILKNTARPQGFLTQTQISYKTGTSHNFKDALAAGSFKNLTAAVWTGRRDGKSNHHYTGLSLAAPLLFKTLNLASSSNFEKEELKPTLALSPEAPFSLKYLNLSLNEHYLGLNPTELIEFIYPQEGETVFVAQGGDLEIKVQGKRPPFSLIYQGQIIATSQDGYLRLKNAQEGFYEFAIMDKYGFKRKLNLRIISSI